jgi:purine-binding chemotaxis protein CheW
MMDNLYLLIEVAGQRAALPGNVVESVVEIDDVTPVPCLPPHVLGLFALRSRVLTVIDSIVALGLQSADRSGDMQAVIVVVDGHYYALLVDQVEDVVAIAGEPMPPRALLSPGWAQMTDGVIEHEGQPLLLINVAALIDGPLAIAA